MFLLITPKDEAFYSALTYISLLFQIFNADLIFQFENFKCDFLENMLQCWYVILAFTGCHRVSWTSIRKRKLDVENVSRRCHCYLHSARWSLVWEWSTILIPAGTSKGRFSTQSASKISSDLSIRLTHPMLSSWTDREPFLTSSLLCSAKITMYQEYCLDSVTLSG